MMTEIHQPTFGRQAAPRRTEHGLHGAAGRYYNTTVSCSCGWRSQVAEAPSYGGKSIAEARFAAHVAEVHGE